MGTVTARHSSSRREPNFAALITGHHLYLVGRPSRWALAHILVYHVVPESVTTIAIINTGTLVFTESKLQFVQSVLKKYILGCYVSGWRGERCCMFMEGGSQELEEHR